MRKISLENIILFENEDYLVLNKPPFLPSLDERSGEGENLLQVVRRDLPEAQLCHRLDKVTSGAIAVAKNPEAYRHLAIQFENRKVDKIYHAVSNGVHAFEEKVVELPIYKGRQAEARIDFSEGREATTIFNTLRAFRHNTLIECKPLTGRFHQIRIHLATQRAPLVSDRLYGGKDIFLSQYKRHYNLKKWEDERPMIGRAALHAASLTFKGLKQETIEVKAEYPKDFRVLVKLLEDYD
nr:RluA family pseudouridine synthase [Hugenholtzia roseola]